MPTLRYCNTGRTYYALTQDLEHTSLSFGFIVQTDRRQNYRGG